MIAIPIVLFSILVAFALFMLSLIVGAIISYIRYCKYQDKKVEKSIEKDYECDNE